MRPPGVWITGHMRSGTSLVAGLMASQGVFMGETRAPSQHNKKGSYEHAWTARVVKNGHPPNWPDSFFEHLVADGWDGRAPWGVKTVAVHHRLMVKLQPAVILLCYRDKESILESCERFGGAGSPKYGRAYRDPMIERHWRIMERLSVEYPGHVQDVWTPELVADPAAGLEALAPALKVLGLTSDVEAARRWVDPKLWHPPGPPAGP